jgi:hypothetical protein
MKDQQQMDEDRMIMILTVLSLLGQEISPEEVQRVYEEAQRKYQIYLAKN